MGNQGEIKAMISLLDDPDDGIYGHVREKLIGFGEQVIPELEGYWEQASLDALMQQRIEEIISQIQFAAVLDRFKKWKLTGAESLLDGLIYLARYQYPDMDEIQVRRKMEELKRDVWLELNDHLTALEQVKVINHILFDVHGFAPNTQNYHAPQNSFINQVLETRKGNPLTLAVIYMVVARSLDLPIYGVNLPNHFVLAYVDTSNVMMHPGFGREVLFYINPFSRGTIFNHPEIEHFLGQLNIEPQASHYSPCSNLAVMQRAVRNLIHSFEKLGHQEKVEQLQELLAVLEE
jgi:regulator of sirC expression with transglutaminase-like and TPR domain